MRIDTIGASAVKSAASPSYYTIAACYTRRSERVRPGQREQRGSNDYYGITASRAAAKNPVWGQPACAPSPPGGETDSQSQPASQSAVEEEAERACSGAGRPVSSNNTFPPRRRRSTVFASSSCSSFPTTNTQRRKKPASLYGVAFVLERASYFAFVQLIFSFFVGRSPSPPLTPRAATNRASKRRFSESTVRRFSRSLSSLFFISYLASSFPFPAERSRPDGVHVSSATHPPVR